METTSIIANLKSLLASVNPGLATQADLKRLENRIDELSQMVETLAEQLNHKKTKKTK
ncbi:MAG: hypothetical protein JW841_11315 [Deltaproteobacteria bacterium]|nr:hypothetical protein [Deltaproteobacteria bacterium]